MRKRTKVLNFMLAVSMLLSTEEVVLAAGTMNVTEVIEEVSTISKEEENIKTVTMEALSNVVASGNCGETSIWTLTDDGTLTISGTGCVGATEDYRGYIEYKDQITYLEIEEGITSIEEVAFDGCRFKGDLNLPKGLMSIGNFAFYHCGFTGSLTLPDELEDLGRGAFAYCDFTGKLTLPEGLKSIEGYAFAYCNFTGDLIVPEGVTLIGKQAFDHCNFTGNLILSEGLKIIESFAFDSCGFIGDVEIPKSVDFMACAAFNECNSIKKIILENPVCKIFNFSFESEFDSDLPSDIIIVGYAESTAIEYAKKYNLKYEYLKDTASTPAAVTELKATSEGKNKVRLTWKHSENADGYLIYGQKNGKYSYVAYTTNNSYVDKKALDNDYNFYWVFAYAGTLNVDAQVGGCTKYVYAKGIIPAVVNLKASSVKGGVKLTWTKRSDADGYLVYGIRGNGSYTYIGIKYGASSTSFTDTKALKQNYNFYWVFPFHYKAGKMVVGGTPKYVYGKSL